jgi:hypothetical protein
MLLTATSSIRKLAPCGVVHLFFLLYGREALFPHISFLTYLWHSSCTHSHIFSSPLLYLLHPSYGCWLTSHGAVSECARMYVSMDEGTLKTPIPKCRLNWSFLFGVVQQFCRFWICKRECKKSCIIWSTTQLNTRHPPPPQPHTVCTRYTVHLVWEGGGGRSERR